MWLQIFQPDARVAGVDGQYPKLYMLKNMGIALIPATAPDFFIEDTPTPVLVRQVLGAIAQFEKASTVAKLAAPGKRKREVTGKCEGQKTLAKTKPEVVVLAKKLRWKRKSGTMSLRTIAAALAMRGHVNENGRAYNPKSIAAKLAG